MWETKATPRGLYLPSPRPRTAARPAATTQSATCGESCGYSWKKRLLVFRRKKTQNSDAKLFSPRPAKNNRVFCADKKYGCGECFPQVSNFDAKQADKTAPASSRFGRHGGCTVDFGSFPFRTCSLKRAADPRRPNPSSYDDFDSWISGAIGVAEQAKEEKKEKEKEGRKEKGGGRGG